MTLSQIIVAMGVVFGTICRWERNAPEDEDRYTDDNLKMKLGHMVFSTIRWCDDLGYDPEECVNNAVKAQAVLAGENQNEEKEIDYNLEMTVDGLLGKSQEIWGKEKQTLEQIIVRMGKIYGDVCRWERNYPRDAETHKDEELQKEFGSIIFSTIYWCNSLGFDPNECIEKAIESQERYVKENYKEA